MMEIRSRIFEKYPEYNFNIPVSEGDRILFQGKSIKEGDVILEKSENSLKKSLNLPKVLRCKNIDCEKYLTTIDGQYIEEGEVIAQKVSKGGLTMVEMTSPVSGVVDLSRIKQGFVDILGEEKSSLIRSDFNGEVRNINSIEGIEVTTDVVSVDGVITSKMKGKLTGILEVLGDGNTIFTQKALEQDYRGKIVWVGPYLYNRVAVELFERGAVAVLTYAMSYIEFRDLGLPIMIFGGFGSVHCDSKFLKKFLSFKNRFTIFDSEENQLYILSSSNINNRGWFVNQYVNQSVISRSISTYGYIGNILEYDMDTKICLVDFDKKGTSLIHIGQLEFIDL